MIPAKLKEFLEQLSDADADEMWEYFDGCLVDELVECIVDSHVGIQANKGGPYTEPVKLC